MQIAHDRVHTYSHTAHSNIIAQAPPRIHTFEGETAHDNAVESVVLLAFQSVQRHFVAHLDPLRVFARAYAYVYAGIARTHTPSLPTSFPP